MTVLILVVMEDALAQQQSELTEPLPEVLILVVMEDALALFPLSEDTTQKGLNPCCNGRCTRTGCPKL